MNSPNEEDAGVKEAAMRHRPPNHHRGENVLAISLTPAEHPLPFWLAKAVQGKAVSASSQVQCPEGWGGVGHQSLLVYGLTVPCQRLVDHTSISRKKKEKVGVETGFWGTGTRMQM